MFVSLCCVINLITCWIAVSWCCIALERKSRVGLHVGVCDVYLLSILLSCLSAACRCLIWCVLCFMCCRACANNFPSNYPGPFALPWSFLSLPRCAHATHLVESLPRCARCDASRAICVYHGFPQFRQRPELDSTLRTGGAEALPPKRRRPRLV